VAQIAVLRNFAPSTVEGHLMDCVLRNELPLEKFVPKQKIETIQEKFLELGDQLGVKPIKEALGDAYSYGEIRAVVNYIRANAQ
jgi:ATP-dependent DNA helicase RecQ